MKKIALILICFISFSNVFSQTVEEKTAIKACECLETKSKIDDDFYRQCISNSLAEVVFSDKDTTSRAMINTVDGIQGLLKKVDDLMPETCRTIKAKKIEEKKKKMYAASNNEVANSYYLTSSDMMDDQKYKLAIEGLEIAIKKDNKFVKAYDHLAVCYRKLEDYDKAIKYYKQSLEIFPEGHIALMNIGVIYTLKSDFKTANVYYERLIKYYPDDAEGYFGAGKNYFLLNKYEEALNNIFQAHIIYLNDKSEYAKDTEQIVAMMYQKLKKENKEELFKKVADKYQIKIQ